MKENKLNELKRYIEDISKMNSALEIIYWDTQTKMPKKAIEQRSGIIEYLSGEIFKMTTSDEMGELLDYFKDTDGLSEVDKLIIKHARKNYDETKKIPEDRYRGYVVAQALSENAWEEAKEQKNFEIFKPHLKKMIDFQREFVEYWGYKDNKYDTLLDKYEEGLTVRKLDKIFSELKDGIIEILDKVQNSNKKVDKSFFIGNFNKESQEKFALFVLKKMGYSFEYGRIDESIHPFTTSFGNRDVRITTNYSNDDFTSALFSSIHEGGHGIFDQSVPDELQRTGLDTDLSMSIHEFKEFAHLNLEEFYEAINYVKPSLIRTEADELTYSLHIIIRYEIEKALINGDLDIDDVKEEWNKKYKEYLGVEPRDDSEGILQDVHWSDGSFGYFPSYALGNIYGAQILHQMEKEYTGMYDDIRNGEFGGVKMWLYENVHKSAALYSPSELIKNITNEELNCKYFLEYLSKKYLSIYK